MKKWLLCLGGLILMTTGACSNTPGEAEILDGMEEFISFHPTEDLTAFFDREGFRDNNFQEEDKGVWNVNTAFREKVDGSLYSRTVQLFFNRNTTEITGVYVKRQASDLETTHEKQYAISLIDGNLLLSEEEPDEEIQAELDQFQFLVQLLEMDRQYLDGLQKVDERYVPESPLYRLNYELPPNDPNLEKIIAAFEPFSENGFSLEEPPILRLYGTGNLEGSTVGRRQLAISFGSDHSPYIVTNINYRQDRNRGGEDEK